MSHNPSPVERTTGGLTRGTNAGGEVRCINICSPDELILSNDEDETGDGERFWGIVIIRCPSSISASFGNV